MRPIDADALINRIVFHSDLPFDQKEAFEDEINAEPTIEPEREKGKLIDGHRMRFDGTFYWFRQCDQCGYERNDCDTEKDTNFCPNCGADMRGEQNERSD